MKSHLSLRLAYIATSYVLNHDGISVYLENVLYELGSNNIEIDVYVKRSVLKKLKSRAQNSSSSSTINFIPVSDSNAIYFYI